LRVRANLLRVDFTNGWCSPLRKFDENDQGFDYFLGFQALPHSWIRLAVALVRIVDRWRWFPWRVFLILVVRDEPSVPDEALLAIVQIMVEATIF
jgi:hypothetical protein